MTFKLTGGFLEEMMISVEGESWFLWASLVIRARDEDSGWPTLLWEMGQSLSGDMSQAL